jgi:outer membrane receptor protein involved in Fe transport
MSHFCRSRPEFPAKSDFRKYGEDRHMHINSIGSNPLQRANGLRWNLRSSTLALAIAIATPGVAHAQDGPAAEADEGQIADIVVTARRTEETLQDIPASVSAIVGDDVARMDSLADVQSLVSGVTFQTVGPIPAVGIRGFGTVSYTHLTLPTM